MWEFKMEFGNDSLEMCITHFFLQILLFSKWLQSIDSIRSIVPVEILRYWTFRKLKANTMFHLLLSRLFSFYEWNLTCFQLVGLPIYLRLSPSRIEVIGSRSPSLFYYSEHYNNSWFQRKNWSICLVRYSLASPITLTQIWMTRLLKYRDGR